VELDGMLPCELLAHCRLRTKWVIPVRACMRGKEGRKLEGNGSLYTRPKVGSLGTC